MDLSTVMPNNCVYALGSLLGRRGDSPMPPSDILYVFEHKMPRTWGDRLSQRTL